MRWFGASPKQSEKAHEGQCSRLRSEFSAYLDGALTGVEMAVLSSHLECCEACASEFNQWRAIQDCLGNLVPVQSSGLQSRLRQAISAERARGSHLPLYQRAALAWRRSIAPMALQLSGGLAATLMLAGGLSWMFGAPVTVQANDDGMAHLVAPQYLYSEVSSELIATSHDVPVVVEAMVDDKGRVYDYSILDGPRNPELQKRIENNLLGSVFRPATVFGAPVRGHVVLTYTGVSVRG